MPHKKSEIYFLLILLAGVLALAFFIFRPFLFALILATVFATVFDPVHNRILTLLRGRRAAAAALATLIVLVVVVVPLTLLGVQVFQEASQLYSLLAANQGTGALARLTTNLLGQLQQLSPLPLEFSPNLGQYFQQALRWLLQHLGLIFTNAAKIILGVFVFVIALYYLFKDGHRFRAVVVDLSPLQDTHDRKIFGKLALAVNSVVKGNLTVAVVQGFLTALGFSLFGIPNPTLWGSAAAVAALIPGVGTSLVILPAILFLLFSGQTLPALGLLVWGVLAVGLIDNFLGPKLVGQGVRLHPFLILLSILGGLALFGPIGFLLGPLVLSLLFALIEIYTTIRQEHVD